jgi:hypothetical protein
MNGFVPQIPSRYIHTPLRGVYVSICISDIYGGEETRLHLPTSQKRHHAKRNALTATNKHYL